MAEVARTGAGILRLAWVFVFEHIVSCTFPFALILGLAATQVVAIPGVPRHDLLLGYCLLLQFLMVRTGLESRRDLLVICLFHVIGVALEIHKTQMGSWRYPGESYLRIAGVPLFAGFMYASVASFMSVAWHRLRITVVGWPAWWKVALITVAIYGQFFVGPWPWGVRVSLALAVVIMFRRSWVHFQLDSRPFRIPMTLTYGLIALFIWFAENIATFLGAWQYPDQAARWQPVGPDKLLAWFLLMIVSFVLVAANQGVKSSVADRGSPEF